MHVSFRNVDGKVFRRFKAQAVKGGLRLGDALTIAMDKWIEEEKEKEDLMKLKPMDWGKGTERSSEDIDEILYGA